LDSNCSAHKLKSNGKCAEKCHDDEIFVIKASFHLWIGIKNNLFATISAIKSHTKVKNMKADWMLDFVLSIYYTADGKIQKRIVFTDSSNLYKIGQN